MRPELGWTHPIVVADLPGEGVEIELVPDDAERAALARHVDVLEVPRLTARFRIVPQQAGAVLEGTLSGAVRQTCVVTLEPFANPIEETISLRFLPRELLSKLEERPDPAEEMPDTLIDGKIDLAAVIAEFLSLAVDPYPRKPGAVFTPPGEGREESPTRSAFAALERLKSPGGTNKR